MIRDEVFVLKKSHPDFNNIKKAIIDSFESDIKWKKMWDTIREKLPELFKFKYDPWLNSFPKYDIIEFIRVRSENHKKKLFETRTERQTKTLRKHGIIDWIGETK